MVLLQRGCDRYSQREDCCNIGDCKPATFISDGLQAKEGQIFQVLVSSQIAIRLLRLTTQQPHMYTLGVL